MSKVQNLKIIRICGDMKSHVIDKADFMEKLKNELEDEPRAIEKDEEMNKERKPLSIITAA